MTENSVAPRSEPKLLTRDQIKSFKRDGFLVVRGMFSPEEMEDITAWTSEVQNRPETPGQQMMYFEQSLTEKGKRILNRIEAFSSYHDGFKTMCRTGKLPQAASDLFEEQSVLFKDKINFKQPGGDGFCAHQDQQAGWDKYASNFISALICVDEATIENGCIEVVAGFHEKGLAGDETKDDAFLFDDDLTPLPATRTTATSEDAPVPEWLKDLGPATEEGIPFGESYVEEDENLARAEVPGWLQDLRPPGTGPLPPLPEARAVDGEPRSEIEGLARAEIPDWVQKLRPEPTAEGEVAVSRDFLPAVLEDEGPLAGLLGVLPATMVVDMPLDFAGASRPEIPEAVVAQAQLWQRLLEQPRSVERPVAQQRVRSGAGEPVSRLLVTVLLIAVTVFGLLAGEPQFSQALSNPHIEALGTAIDALAPGDVVIVAVEYGPAEAGEMSTIAEALLEHLAEKQVQVIAVSTLPEGVGLAYGLLDKVGLSNALPAERSSFLSGAANGVAMFLSEGEADGELLIVLSARAERLRWWIELNNVSRSVDGVSIDPLPIGVGASASVAPMAAPYLASSNVKGWLAGFPDVVAYREFRGVTDSYFNRRLDALLLSHWVALALLIFGLCYYLAAGKKGNA